MALQTHVERLVCRASSDGNVRRTLLHGIRDTFMNAQPLSCQQHWAFFPPIILIHLWQRCSSPSGWEGGSGGLEWIYAAKLTKESSSLQPEKGWLNFCAASENTSDVESWAEPTFADSGMDTGEKFCRIQFPFTQKGLIPKINKYFSVVCWLLRRATADLPDFCPSQIIIFLFSLKEKKFYLGAWSVKLLLGSELQKQNLTECI